MGKWVFDGLKYVFTETTKKRAYPNRYALFQLFQLISNQNPMYSIVLFTSMPS